MVCPPETVIDRLDEHSQPVDSPPGSPRPRASRRRGDAADRTGRGVPAGLTRH